jgi:hypothetical protein
MIKIAKFLNFKVSGLRLLGIKVSVPVLRFLGTKVLMVFGNKVSGFRIQGFKVLEFEVF